MVFHSITHYDPFDHLSYITQQWNRILERGQRVKTRLSKIQNGPSLPPTMSLTGMKPK